jgi:hypothetical protein
MQVTDVNGSGTTAILANVNYYAPPDIVLGDQGTYFISDGNQIINVNESSGSEQWRWQPSSGTVQIIAATAGGGLAVKNLVVGQENVVRLDASANPTYDTWGTAGGSSGYGVISNASYFAGLWYGVDGDPVLEAIVGEPKEDAFLAWPEPGGGGTNNGGSKQAVIYHFVPQAITGLNYQQFVEDSVPEGPNTNFKIPVRHVFVTNSNATADRFITDLKSGAAAVSFIGDSVGYPSGNGTVQRYALRFYNQLLVSPNTPSDLKYPGYSIVSESMKQIAPDTQIVFIGACDIDSNMRQWLVPVTTTGQAFILPDPPPTPTYLGPASEAWVAMLENLANGNNVTTSVDNGNTYLKNNPPQPKPADYVRPIWGVVGDGTFKIKASQ